jgi:hypothetical protein
MPVLRRWLDFAAALSEIELPAGATVVDAGNAEGGVIGGSGRLEGCARRWEFPELAPVGLD